jgi:DNA-binding GntR family transcriptional regulator
MKKEPSGSEDISAAKEEGSRRKLTRAEEVRARLADDIVDGKLSPGMPLDETEIAASYGVSRTPLREAIRDLAAMGLVETRPHRSAIVTRPSPEHLRQMFHVMAELEALCASLAAASMTLSERRNLEIIHEGLARILKENDPSHYHVLNEKFHAAIYAGSQNAYLVEITLATRRRLSPFRRAQFLTAGRLAKSYKEHDAILVAILQGNRELAAESMRRHILTVEDSYEEYAGLK